MDKKIPISVVVITKNEEARIERCLAVLRDFDDLWVVDSNSADQTKSLAEKAGAQVINFTWDGQYPKKKQWCLDHLPLKYDWVFFVDADEIVTGELREEISAFDPQIAGYYVRGRYVFEGKTLSHGLLNNKLSLINRTKMEFPVVDDLDIQGVGEIEGHYQPVLKGSAGQIGQLRAPLLHYAYDDMAEWEARHQRYAEWERRMNERASWPQEVRLVKRFFKMLPLQGLIAFLHSYILRLGFLDGAAGFRFAKTRWAYYRMI